jgi:hypothetical protein
MSDLDPKNEDQLGGPQSLDTVAGIARIAISAWWHATEWAVRTSLRVPQRIVVVALAQGKTGDPPVEPSMNGRSNGHRPDAAARLREQGEELLHKSRDVHHEDEAHPAYARILSELAPDEARILRLMLLEGPQAAVDVRTGGPVGIVRSRLLAPGLSMIGPRAGCRYVDRVPSYLNNLFRLGLIWFSRETLRDPQRYQVLEAQPDVLAAIKSVRQAKVVRRSIHLTPFGEDFCRVCLSADDSVLEGLPAHSMPPETPSAPQPPE